MGGEYLLPVLALGTMGIVAGVALWSRNRTLARKADPDAPKSSLAKDGPGPQPFR